MSSPAFKPLDEPWHAYELADGETITGTVVRLPTRAADNATRLFLRLPDRRVIGIPASARKGHTLLERQLEDLEVIVGDTLTIVYAGKRRTADGEREYRLYDVRMRRR